MIPNQQISQGRTLHSAPGSVRGCCPYEIPMGLRARSFLGLDGAKSTKKGSGLNDESDSAGFQNSVWLLVVDLDI